MVYDEQNKVTVSLATVRQYAYENRINLIKTEPTAESVLNRIKNTDLKRLLTEYRFTAANQTVAAMKGLGYEHRVRKGIHTFTRNGERVSIRHKDLTKFASPKLENAQMEDIIGRFNLYKYRLEGAFYQETVLKSRLYHSRPTRKNRWVTDSPSVR